MQTVFASIFFSSRLLASRCFYGSYVLTFPFLLRKLFFMYVVFACTFSCVWFHKRIQLSNDSKIIATIVLLHFVSHCGAFVKNSVEISLLFDKEKSLSSLEKTVSMEP